MTPENFKTLTPQPKKKKGLSPLAAGLIAVGFSVATAFAGGLVRMALVARAFQAYRAAALIKQVALRVELEANEDMTRISMIVVRFNELQTELDNAIAAGKNKANGLASIQKNLVSKNLEFIKQFRTQSSSTRVTCW